MSESCFVYIITNSNKTVLYTGVTNDLVARLRRHADNAGKRTTFAGRYNCQYLLYFETFQYIVEAITREKEIKRWAREKKIALIKTVNPEMVFLEPGHC